MFNFIKKLFGVKTPVTTAAQAPYKVEPPKEIAIIPVVNTDAPTKKRRRPRNRNRAAGGTVAKVNQPKPAITEGKTKGGNGTVKQPKANTKKPKSPTRVK